MFKIPSMYTQILEPWPSQSKNKNISSQWWGAQGRAPKFFIPCEPASLAKDEPSILFQLENRLLGATNLAHAGSMRNRPLYALLSRNLTFSSTVKASTLQLVVSPHHTNLGNSIFISTLFQKVALCAIE